MAPARTAAYGSSLSRPDRKRSRSSQSCPRRSTTALSWRTRSSQVSVSVFVSNAETTSSHAAQATAPWIDRTRNSLAANTSRRAPSTSLKTPAGGRDHLAERPARTQPTPAFGPVRACSSDRRRSSWSDIRSALGTALPRITASAVSWSSSSNGAIGSRSGGASAPPPCSCRASVRIQPGRLSWPSKIVVSGRTTGVEMAGACRADRLAPLRLARAVSRPQ